MDDKAREVARLRESASEKVKDKDLKEKEPVKDRATGFGAIADRRGTLGVSKAPTKGAPTVSTKQPKKPGA